LLPARCGGVQARSADREHPARPVEIRRKCCTDFGASQGRFRWMVGLIVAEMDHAVEIR
jgi:hypothetical protein